MENAVHMFDSDNDQCSKCRKIFLPGEAIDIRTNFNKITESPEALADFLSRTIQLYDGRIKWAGKTEPFQTFDTKSEAVTATLAWLNQEAKK